MAKKLIAIGIAIAAAGCGGGGGSSAPSPASPPSAVAPSTPASSPARPYPQTDAEIAELIYSGHNRTPDGFYTEPVPGGASYATTAHLKNADVETNGTDAPVHEVCTDDWNQALEWSETAATRTASYADLVETNSEARFFEFVRVPRETPTALLRQRVFRCGYLDRVGVDLQTVDGPGGRLNRRPLAPADVQQLAEYLWHFTAFNNFGHVVLASAAANSQSGPAHRLAHSLIIATLHRAASAADCDRIEVTHWTHAVDSVTGVITRSTVAIATVHARESDGHATLCEAP